MYTYLLTYLHIYLFTCLLIYIFTYLHIYLHIPLISQVRGQYGKLWTEFFFPFLVYENKEGKNADP